MKNIIYLLSLFIFVSCSKVEIPLSGTYKSNLELTKDYFKKNYPESRYYQNSDMYYGKLLQHWTETSFTSQNNHYPDSQPAEVNLSYFTKKSENYFIIKEGVNNINHFHILSKDLYYIEVHMPKYIVREYFQKEK